MKYRLVIADDERKIIQLIKQLGHWEELNIEIVDECINGRTAYESIREKKPDLVLLDIKMPVYDGIELIQKLRDEGINPFFILLSGYRHFEYARSAIQLNVVDYLLKPIDEEQLNRTLKRVCACIEEARMQEEETSILSTWKNDRDQEKREEFWKVIIDGPEIQLKMNGKGKNLWEYPDFSYDREMCANLFHMELPYDCFQVLCIFSNLSSILGHSNSAGHKKVEGFIQECMQKRAVTYYHTTYMGYIILLNYDKEKAKEVRQAICALYYHILDLSELYGEIRLNIGISSEKKKLSELPKAFQEARDSEWGRLVYTKGSLVMLLPEERMVLLGDACNGNTFVFEEYSTSIEDYQKSLIALKEKLEGKFDTVLTSHGDGNGYVGIMEEHCTV